MTIAQIEALITGRTDGGNNKISAERALWTALKNELFKIGELKDIAMSNADISTYFESSGLGKSGTIYEGWAICNGSNGTWDYRGRSSIGYDITDYQTLGASGGAKNKTLSISEIPAHTHTWDPGYEGFQAGGNNSAASRLNPPSHAGSNTKTTNPTGGGASFSLMNPYVVTLKIQRIA